MSTNIITLSKLKLAFGHHALLDNAELIIQSKDRIGLIGRNGAGKSSLLKIIDGRIQPDDGEVIRASSVRITTVEQEPELDEEKTIFETLCTDYINAEDWQRPARANILIDQLGLNPDALIKGLSGGMRKRVALAQAMTNEPDLLLLDEPTNHLDFEGIQWLEDLIKNSSCAVVIITHDRRFLDNVTTRIIELDRGQILSFPGNYSTWLERKAQWLAAQELEFQRADKFLAQEEVWIRKGIQARRTRDEGRVRRLEQLRRDRAARREMQGKVNMSIEHGSRSGKIVAELKNINHGYDDKVLIKDFSTTILRQDRIGFIGPNGSGKSTLLKILLGKIQPNSGEVKLGTNLSIGYFDQMRGQLDEDATVAETINPGSEWVEIGNQRKHVMSYLEDFLFSPMRSNSPVKSLSGGERGRLALARMFAQPNNILVLDEPTNDLDIETLELLESLLQEYQGTVLLVSHDREFLNNVITHTIVAQGDGNWNEFVGGYDDFVQQQSLIQKQQLQEEDINKQNNTADSNNKNTKTQSADAKNQDNKPTKSNKDNNNKPNRQPGKLASWEQKELDEIPAKIAALEDKQSELSEKLSNPDTYKDGTDLLDKINAEINDVENELNQLFERWEFLESKTK